MEAIEPFKPFQARRNRVQGRIHHWAGILQRLERIHIQRGLGRQSVIIEDLELGGGALVFGVLGVEFRGLGVNLTTDGAHILLDGFTDLFAYLTVDVEHRTGRFAQVMKLTNLMRNIWPYGGNGLQERFLGIAHRSHHGDAQVTNGLEQGSHGRRIAAADVLGSEQASGDHVPHEVDGFAAFIRLNSIN